MLPLHDQVSPASSLKSSARREEREWRAVELVTDRLTVKEPEVLPRIARGLTSQ